MGLEPQASERLHIYAGCFDAAQTVEIFCVIFVLLLSHEGRAFLSGDIGLQGQINQRNGHDRLKIATAAHPLFMGLALNDMSLTDQHFAQMKRCALGGVAHW